MRGRVQGGGEGAASEPLRCWSRQDLLSDDFHMGGKERLSRTHRRFET